jgi:PEP-CTERM motif-containing protein
MHHATKFVIASLALGITAMASQASATALYTVSADCGVPAFIGNSPTPVSTSGTCAGPGISIFTSAASAAGHVGVASTLSGDTSAGRGGTLFALFTTEVTFTATGGSTATSIPVALNLSLDGTATSTGTSFTQWRAFGGVTQEVGGSFDIGSEQDLTGTTHSGTGIASGPTETLAVGSDTVSGTMTTNTFDAQVGVPRLLSLELLLTAGGTSDMEFLNSLDLPTGSDVFNLPAGFTANDADGIIVNNRFGSTAIPEPSAMLLLATGLVSLVALRRRT